MSNNDNSFDTILDSIVETVKRAGTVAGKKTTEAVEIGKIKYREQSVARELTKSYTKLGALVYEAKTKGEDLEDVIAENIARITELNQQLDDHTEMFSTAIEEIKKPVEHVSATTADLDIDLSKATEAVKEAASDIAEDTKETAEKAVEEVNELIDDLKDKID